MPAWGREEAFAYLGLCHKQTGNMSKAREFLKKALEISPDFAFASRELKTIPEK
jgi:Tfp pilus assembly protein PilF